MNELNVGDLVEVVLNYEKLEDTLNNSFNPLTHKNWLKEIKKHNYKQGKIIEIDDFYCLLDFADVYFHKDMLVKV